MTIIRLANDFCQCASAPARDKFDQWKTLQSVGKKSIAAVTSMELPGGIVLTTGLNNNTL